MVHEVRSLMTLEQRSRQITCLIRLWWSHLIPFSRHGTGGYGINLLLILFIYYLKWHHYLDATPMHISSNTGELLLNADKAVQQNQVYMVCLIFRASFYIFSTFLQLQFILLWLNCVVCFPTCSIWRASCLSSCIFNPFLTNR